jgi:tetratricopeptide (TPR) repeat protein
MLTEDYLMRIINQALVVLMKAIGLRKAGNYGEAQQTIQQAIEQVMTLPANIVDQMDDSSILSLLVVHGQLDVRKVGLLADLYQEEGEILLMLDQPTQASLAFDRALRFILESALSDDGSLLTENFVKVKTMVQQVEGHSPRDETKLALSDYYQRMLEIDEKSLITAGTSSEQLNMLLASMQDPILPENNKGD